MTINTFAGWGQLPATFDPPPTIAQTLSANQAAQAAKFDALTKAVAASGQSVQTALTNLNANCTLVFPASASTLVNNLVTLIGATSTNVENVANAISNQKSLATLAAQVCELREYVRKTESSVGILAGVMSKQATWPRHIPKLAWTLLGILVELRAKLLHGPQTELSSYLEQKGKAVMESEQAKAIKDINEDLATEFHGLFRAIDSTEYESGRNERLIEVARVERTLMIELG